MTAKVQVRYDELDQKDGIFSAAWGMSVPWAHPIWSEYVLFLYDIKAHAGVAAPILHKEGMTYEFVLHALDPNTKIDFSKNLFDQPALSPLQPANMGYQFKAASNEEAVSRIKPIIDLIENGQMSPDTDFARAWHPFFTEGFDLLSRGFGGILPEGIKAAE